MHGAGRLGKLAGAAGPEMGIPLFGELEAPPSACAVIAGPTREVCCVLAVAASDFAALISLGCLLPALIMSGNKRKLSLWKECIFPKLRCAIELVFSNLATE